jgi:hypothetical protein
MIFKHETRHQKLVRDVQWVARGSKRCFSLVSPRVIETCAQTRVLVRFTHPLLIQRTATVTRSSCGSFHHVSPHPKCVKVNHPLTETGFGAGDAFEPTNKENKQVNICWLILGFFKDSVSTAQTIYVYIQVGWEIYHEGGGTKNLKGEGLAYL